MLTNRDFPRLAVHFRVLENRDWPFRDIDNIISLQAVKNGKYSIFLQRKTESQLTYDGVISS